MNEKITLRTSGITMISYSDKLQAAVADAAEAWRAYSALPQAEKDRSRSNDAHVGSGYEKKGDGTIESGDTKENFDLTFQGIDQIRAQQIDSTSALLDTTEALLRVIKPTADEFIKIASEEGGLPDFASTARMSEANRFIRYLYYPPAPEGTILGEAHTDHSGYTFHLFESTDGCKGLTQDTRSWFDMPVAVGEMAAFSGMQLQLLSQGRIKALCHQITANQVTARVGRIAIVCFNMLSGVPGYDRGTHGRLQEKLPGFNYDMSHDDFQALFTTTPR